MASSGPNSPGTLVNDASVGTYAWNTPGNAISSNDSRTNVYAGFGVSITNYLKVTNFGFSIPGGATIDGIVVEVEKQSQVNNWTKPIDNICKLVKGGVIGGTNKASGAEWIYNVDTISTYGGATDLWGETWSDSDINASNFGFAISTTIYFDGKYGPGIPAIDHVRITVYYTAGGGGGSVSKLGLLGVG